MPSWLSKNSTKQKTTPQSRKLLWGRFGCSRWEFQKTLWVSLALIFYFVSLNSISAHFFNFSHFQKFVLSLLKSALTEILSGFAVKNTDIRKGGPDWRNYRNDVVQFEHELKITMGFKKSIITDYQKFYSFYKFLNFLQFQKIIELGQ